jgi:TRAP-type C4-dicarboxylate transport system substrate-binding protein
MVLIMALPLEASPITLRFSSYNPPRGMESECELWLIERIEKHTNGKVKFEHYSGEALLKARETLKGIQAGTADMGFLMTAYFPKELPFWSVAQPFINGPSQAKKTAAFFWELYEKSPILKAELDKWNQKLVAIHVFGKMGLGGPKPIKSLADVKGIRVRCAGGYDALHIGALGGQVVFLPAPEAYTAMEKGALDACYTPFISYYKYKLYEIGAEPNLLEIPKFNGTVGLITINLKTWNKLPDDVQKAISEAGREYTEINAEKELALDQDYRDKMKKAGCTITDITNDEVKKWANLIEAESKAKWLDSVKDQGAQGKEIMEQASQLIKKYSD